MNYKFSSLLIFLLCLNTVNADCNCECMIDYDMYSMKGRSLNNSGIIELCYMNDTSVIFSLYTLSPFKWHREKGPDTFLISNKMLFKKDGKELNNNISPSTFFAPREFEFGKVIKEYAHPEYEGGGFSKNNYKHFEKVDTDTSNIYIFKVTSYWVFGGSNTKRKTGEGFIYIQPPIGWIATTKTCQKEQHPVNDKENLIGVALDIKKIGNCYPLLNNFWEHLKDP